MKSLAGFWDIRFAIAGNARSNHVRIWGVTERARCYPCPGRSALRRCPARVTFYLNIGGRSVPSSGKSTKLRNRASWETAKGSKMRSISAVKKARCRVLQAARARSSGAGNLRIPRSSRSPGSCRMIKKTLTGRKRRADRAVLSLAFSGNIRQLRQIREWLRGQRRLVWLWQAEMVDHQPRIRISRRQLSFAAASWHA